ncbi:tRNA (adenosine(37)-N6)-threonylcarbamoyltransferase complex ATPase subunit type 1 TsaE [Alloscardovia theropitheci]|uniref:tRNA threonylcarbamoyladenosine biosynthesis protein TsaE n=1 Tax=Alloscardovia theropitheci TaxID=2496842 RepID=A0A4V2MU84_9BIFI|nr:tRNA (adenosine(37)-N6)-threonylcarbamoyltransferase complex ATPase subunit type 1 TsaE [Alloscardovia theropitheci]TCD53629.1 tRNA (adenosine(37)-N6)-threonylcarbamoyltransferase complex ATPase subunit type 1 TsaE [Alloscardovia theropitheci]
MHVLGHYVAEAMHGGDVIVLSGPLGAGKTTFTQGVGIGLQIKEPVVSPTFTIARELQGQFSNGTHAHLIHVDAYRLPGSDNDDVMYEAMNANEQSQQYAHNAANRLLDELESLGLDEVLEDPDDNTVILIEWGSMMASVLADNRLEIDIDRSVTDNLLTESDELTGDGMRRVTLRPVGKSWEKRAAKVVAEYLHYVQD